MNLVLPRQDMDRLKRDDKVYCFKLCDDPVVHAALLGLIHHLRNRGVRHRFQVNNDLYELFSRSNVAVEEQVSEWCLDLSGITDELRLSYRYAIENFQHERLNSVLFNSSVPRSAISLPTPNLGECVWLSAYEFVMGAMDPHEVLRNLFLSWVIPHETLRVVRRNRTLPHPYVLYVYRDDVESAVKRYCPYPVLEYKYGSRDVHELMALSDDKRCLATVSGTDCPFNLLFPLVSNVHIQLLVPSSDRYTNYRSQISLPPASGETSSVYEQVFALL